VKEKMQIRVRLTARLAELFRAPFLTIDLADGATVADLYARLAETEPDAAPALRSALAVVAGEHAGRDDLLRHRQEVALLLPISGG
jgi:MoaE-MoaD fusion protein